VLLRGRLNNNKDRWSEHGLGHVLNPSDPMSEDRDWIGRTWLNIVRRSLGLSDQLRQMVYEDNLDGRLHADYADSHLPDARLAEYRSLMRATGVMRLWGHGRSRPLELLVDANGWLNQGQYKGYWYDPSGPQQSSSSLDDSCFEIAEARKEERYCSAVRTLGDGWWLLRYEYRARVFDRTGDFNSPSMPDQRLTRH
jgi:hypothetical protein